MAAQRLPPSNFAQLQEYDDPLAHLGTLAEKYLADDPNTSLIKMRQFAELLAQTTAAQMGLYQSEAHESQYELLRRLREEGVFSQEIYLLFGEIRRAGNEASHALQGDCEKELNWFNAKILFLERDIVRYAFIHLLCHIQEMNPSAQF
jgi:type I restriction enzyme, R subunit